MSMGLTETLILIASVISAVTVISIFGSKLFKVFRKFVRFLDDFNGVEERPGIDRHPGFPERIKQLEDHMVSISSKLDTLDSNSGNTKKLEENLKQLCTNISEVQTKLLSIEKELHPNHGTSMRDAVDRIQLRLNLVEENLHSHVSK